MTEYSETVHEHFKNPRNAGIIEDADGVGEIGDPECGDYMMVYVRIADDRIKDVKYQIEGCPASIACASAMTELTAGRTIEDALMIDEDEILVAVGGLPVHKQHCSNLSAGAFRNALMEYFNNI